MILTKTEFQSLWCEWTDDQPHEARHRIRICSEAGLLPNRSDPMTIEDIVKALLAFLGSDTHKGAPAVVQQFSNFRCGAFEPHGDEVIASDTLRGAIATSLQRPFSLVSLTVSSNGRWAKLHVIRNSDPFTNCMYSFTDPVLGLPQTTFPVIISREIGSELTKRMSDLIDKIKATEAPPSSDLHSASKQAAKPAQPNTEQLTLARATGQSRKRDGLPIHSETER